MTARSVGAAEVLTFCGRWSKSTQARCVRGIFAFSPGFGEHHFWRGVGAHAKGMLAPIYESRLR